MAGPEGGEKKLMASSPPRRSWFHQRALCAKTIPHRHLSDFYQAGFNTALDPYPSKAFGGGCVERSHGRQLVVGLVFGIWWRNEKMRENKRIHSMIPVGAGNGKTVSKAAKIISISAVFGVSG